MRKVFKAGGYVALAVALLLSFAVIINTMVNDYLFDKIFDYVVKEKVSEAKKQSKEEAEQTATTPSEELPEDGENNPEEENGEPVTDKPVKTPEKPRIKDISELTPEEIEGIKALVSPADKTTVINIVKSALTADDKREIKAMLDSGNVDYGRCQQIASARLSVGQKKQIYAYYEKYAEIYFANN